MLPKLLPKSQPADEPREHIDSAVSWLEQGVKIALLTLVNIEGSAPYPVGSQMLVSESGDYRGQITGGCAEAALVEQAKAVITSGINCTERYGLDSPYFDIRLPCGSGVDVYFDVTTGLDDYRLAKAKLEQRTAISRTIEWRDNGVLRQFDKRYLPNERLLLIGQGPIIPSLTELARLSGFDVTVVPATTETSLSVGLIKQYCDQYTALVSLFHEHELEIELLATALQTDAFYIGALGSQRTHQARLSSLAERVDDAEKLASIHGPVGIDIGAVSPAQIAISIMSEVIAVMNQ